MDCKNKVLSSPYFLVAIILIIVSLVITLYWFFTRKPILSEENKGLDELQKISADIYEINSSFTSCIDNQSINADVTSKNLELNIPKLEKIKTSLCEIEVSTNADLKNSIEKSLNYNINTYNLILTILNSPKSPEVIDSFSKLQDESENLFNSLETFNDKPVSYNLSEDTKIFINNSISYIKNIIKINRDLSLTRANLKDYLAEIYPIYDSLNEINTDLITPLKNIENDETQLKRLDSHVYKKQLSLATAKNKFTDISIPNNCLTNYCLLNDTIESCNKYLDSLSNCIKKNIDNKSSGGYETAENNYKEFKDNLDKFYTNYINLK